MTLNVTHELGESGRISLLVRRAGFAAGPGDVQRYEKLGWEATLQELLHPETVDDDLDALLTRLQGGLLDLQNLEDVQTWWLYRMLHTRRPLQEKLTLFWHGHFAVANYKVNNARMMHQHIELLRAHSLGRFDDLLMGVSRDPAMLIWLDGSVNHRNAPNENYGRELLELYTLGIGNYDEDDVLSAARAFTGWNLRNNEFFFDDNNHDAGDKTFLGQQGTHGWRRHPEDRRQRPVDSPADLAETLYVLRLSEPGARKSWRRWSIRTTAAAMTSAPWWKRSCARTRSTPSARSSSISSRPSSTSSAPCSCSRQPSASASSCRCCARWVRRS